MIRSKLELTVRHKGRSFHFPAGSRIQVAIGRSQKSAPNVPSRFESPISAPLAAPRISIHAIPGEYEFLTFKIQIGTRTLRKRTREYRERTNGINRAAAPLSSIPQCFIGYSPERGRIFKHELRDAAIQGLRKMTKYVTGNSKCLHSINWLCRNDKQKLFAFVLEKEAYNANTMSTRIELRTNKSN